MNALLRVVPVCFCLACSDVTAVVGAFELPKVRTLDASSSGGPRPDESVSADSAPGTAADTGQSSASGVGSQPAVDMGPDAAQQSGAPARGSGQALIEAGTHEVFCRGQGLPVHLPSDNSEDCSPRLARQLFAYALCACEELRGQAALSVDAFDADHGPYTSGRATTGAAVGVNGRWSPGAGPTLLRGSVVVAGSEAVSLTGPLDIAGDLKLNGSLQVMSDSVAVGRDVWLGGDASGSDSVAVGRAVYQTPRRTGRDLFPASSAYQAQAVDVQPPCACGDRALDIRGLIEQAQLDNDNASEGIARDALSQVTLTTDLFRALPCGRFALDSVNFNVSTLAIAVAGRTALFVSGDFVSAGGTIGFDVGDTGELDIFVGGDLFLQSTNLIGNPARPHATRIYVAGQVVGGAASNLVQLAAALYAPNAIIENFGAPELYGSILARTLVSNALTLHYDRAIVGADRQCIPPAASCDGCYACEAGLACVTGACRTCERDSDCCEPFVCSEGRCQPL